METYFEAFKHSYIQGNGKHGFYKQSSTICPLYDTDVQIQFSESIVLLEENEPQGKSISLG
jgi:hypothetical protein